MPEFIDLTPEVLKTPEGAKRVSEALNAWQDTQANLASLAASFFREFAPDVKAALPDLLEDVREIQQAMLKMSETQEAFLRSIGGK